MKPLSRPAGRRTKKILAVASGGGHWVQLLRIRPAFEQYDVVFTTVHRSYQSQVPGRTFYEVSDSNIWNPVGLLRTAWQITRILLKERPDIVISTGAAPGYFALRLGALFGAHTIWIESIANVAKLSISGRNIGPHADLWLTQWPALARPTGPSYAGSVL